MENFDLVIVGAGPAGTTAALFAHRKGLRVLLIDKAVFPRDKICGDAISGKSVSILKRLNLVEKLEQREAIDSWGVTFSGPYGDEVGIPFKSEQTTEIPGYIARRWVFDHLLAQEVLAEGIAFWQNATFKSLRKEGDVVKGVVIEKEGDLVNVDAPIVLGADGAYSQVAKALGFTQLDEKHYCAGVRIYYEGVTGFHAKNHVELHFVEEAIPGYFWIFPMQNGLANVGVGMLSYEIKKNDIKLKEVLDKMINHPKFVSRFADAKAIGVVKGWGLPLGSQPRPLAGNGWMLLGDAGSLIDPFTGEGIGNAMLSGEVAAKWAFEAHQNQQFDATFLKSYEAEVLRKLSSELKISHLLQKLSRWKWLMNTVIAKASRNPEIAEAISLMFDDHSQRKKLATFSFYWKVLSA